MTGVLVALQTHGDTVSLSDQTIDDTEVSPATAAASYSLVNTGLAQKATTAGTTPLGSWVIPNGSAGLYEVMAILNGGSLTSGTTGSWLALSSSQTWLCNVAVGPGTKAADLTIQIRLAGTVTVLATARIILSATSA